MVGGTTIMFNNNNRDKYQNHFWEEGGTIMVYIVEVGGINKETYTKEGGINKETYK